MELRWSCSAVMRQPLSNLIQVIKLLNMDYIRLDWYLYSTKRLEISIYVLWKHLSVHIYGGYFRP